MGFHTLFRYEYKRFIFLLSILIISQLLLGALLDIPLAKAVVDPTATDVLGQVDLNQSQPNEGTTFFNTFTQAPGGIAVDGNGGVYISYRCTIFYYPSGSTTPSTTKIYGRKGTFSSQEDYDYNNGKDVIDATTVCAQGLALDSTGGLYAVDSYHSRVLYFANDGDTVADKVYGQPDFTSYTFNNGDVNDHSLNFPDAIAIDSSNGLYVADTNNNRILYFANDGNTNADRVYGQPDFNSRDYSDPPTVNSLAEPQGITLDSSNNLYVSDTDNNRVFVYPNNSTTPSRVLGQADYTSRDPHCSLNGLYYPMDLRIDSTGGLYIADSYNNRVVYYQNNATTASRVIGQPDNGTSCQQKTASNSTLSTPLGLALDTGNNLYIGDGYLRVLFFPSQASAATRVYGQLGRFSSSNPTVNASSLGKGNQVATDSSGGIYVVDTDYNRVLYYANDGDRVADRVYGQPDFYASDDAGYYSTPTSLYHPKGVAISSDGIYIYDAGCGRVLFYPGTSTTATISFLGSLQYSCQFTLSADRGFHIAVDGDGGLYVVQTSYHRVYYFVPGSNGLTPDRVYGQPDPYSATPNNGGISASSLNEPTGVATDATGVYITDRANNRMLFYPDVSTTASRVYGQNNNFTTNTEGELTRPQDVAIGSSGVFVAASVGIKLYTGVSTSSTQFCTQDEYYGFNGITGNLCDIFGASALTINSSGNIFVSLGNFVAFYQNENADMPTRAYGRSDNQSNSFGYFQSNNISLDAPAAVTVDNNGGKYVADKNNNRVLYFPPGSTTPSKVYGQGGDLTTSATNKGGLSAVSLNSPTGLALDAGNDLYVADSGNHRVLYFPANSTTATRVFGQSNSFTTRQVNKSGLSANSLDYPTGLGVDSNGGLFVADTYNNRLLYFANDSNTTADKVYGQLNFTSKGVPDYSDCTKGLYHPGGVAVDSQNNVYVGDAAYNVKLYSGTSATLLRIYGKDLTGTTCTSDPVTANSLNGSTSIALDNSGVYISDTYDNRILYFPGTSTTPSGVIGQKGSFTTSDSNVSKANNSLSSPQGIFFDKNSKKLYVADTYNNRVLGFPTTETPPSDCLNVTIATDTGTNTCNTLTGAITTANNANSSQPIVINLQVSGPLLVQGTLPKIDNIGGGSIVVNGGSCTSLTAPTGRTTLQKDGSNSGNGLILGSNVTLQCLTIGGFVGNGIQIEGKINLLDKVQLTSTRLKILAGGNSRVQYSKITR